MITVIAQDEAYKTLAINNLGGENIAQIIMSDGLENEKIDLDNDGIVISAEKVKAIEVSMKLALQQIKPIVFIQEFINEFREDAIKYEDCFWTEIERDKDASANLLKKLVDLRLIVSVFLSVGTACTLKCKNCMPLNPYTPSCMKRYTIESLVRDIRTLASVVDFIPSIILVGGEPLIHTDIATLIDEIAAADNIGKIIIATNGTFIPNDKVLKTLRDNKVFVRISNYSIKESRAVELEEICSKWGIGSERYNFVTKKSMWFDFGIDNNECASDEEAKNVFEKCISRTRFIQDGELFACSRFKNASIVQGFEPADTDVVKLDPENPNLRDRIREYFRNPRFMTSCRYCNGTQNDKLCIPGEQLEVEEWKQILKARNY